jgi:hypothetical protein
MSAPDVRDLCHWRRGLVPDVSHRAFHYGALCPYDVVDAVLAGQPDPRDAGASWRIDISAALTIKGAVPLSLNDRMHWAARAKAVDRVKAIVRNAVMAAEIPHLDHVHVEMHYRPKTNRFRDIDNTVATLKTLSMRCITATPGHRRCRSIRSWTATIRGS